MSVFKVRIKVLIQMLAILCMSNVVFAQNPMSTGQIQLSSNALPATNQATVIAPGNNQQATTPTPSTSATNNAGGAANIVGTSPTAGATATPEVISSGNGTEQVIQTVYCPQPTQLVKNGMYWGTPTGGWKSYSESFDKSITSFVGAQWVGINVGKMVCIYKGNLTMSFSIPVQNDTLSQAPVGSLWGKDLGGYRNCHSTNVLDCPFVVKTQRINIQEIYRSLDFFKGKPNPLTQN